MRSKAKGKMKLRKKIALAFLIILLLGAMGIYVYAVSYFSEHFYNGSRINGMDCSYKTVPEVKRDIDTEIKKYTLTLKTMEGNDEVITAPDVNLTYIDDNKVDELLAEQRPMLWFLSFGSAKQHEMAANTSYDEGTIDGILKSLGCFDEGTVTPPADAYLQENENDFEIIPEVDGNKLDYEKVKRLVVEAIEEGKSELSLVAEQCYLKPQIYRDNVAMNEKCNSLNQLSRTSIGYDFGEERTETIGWNVIKTWITKDENGDYIKNENGEYAFNPELVRFGIANFAEKYNTYAKERDFKTTSGEIVSLSRANYGWELEQEKMNEELFAALVANKVGANEVVWSRTAIAHHNTDMGGTYVEISITKQRMWCYQDGELMVDTPVVTGNVEKQWDTPKGGIWTIFWKVSPYILRGEVDENGEPEYEAPVTYWMPFNGGVGIHDLPTRSEYGGDIYLTGGSHGCVNTPFEAAKKIYGIVKVGTPVVVY